MSTLGTNGSDYISQDLLGIEDWSLVIEGLEGDDTLIGGNIQLNGGAGNDVLIGTTPGTTIQYWDSPEGVFVDLSVGTAEDGWGTVDSIQGISTIQGSGYADVFVGSGADEQFWVWDGDRIEAGEGYDVLHIWDFSTNWKIETPSFLSGVATNLTTGDRVNFSEVEEIQFKDTELNLAYDVFASYRESAFDSLDNTFVLASSADLNLDGLTDIVLGKGRFPPDEAIATPIKILLQNSDRTFSEATINGSVEDFVHPREIDFGDFNGDGIADVVVIGHGYDTAPFEGETATVFLGQEDGSFLDNSEALPSTPAFTHSVTVADVNADGYDDIYLGTIWGRSQEKPKLLLGSVSGSFEVADLPQAIGEGALTDDGVAPITSLLDDFNDDGYVDILVAGDSRQGTWIYYGNGSASENLFLDDGIQLPPGIFGAENTTSVDSLTFDVDGDGLKDLILSQTRFDPFYSGRGLQVLLQTAEGGWIDETSQHILDLNPDDQWIQFVNLHDVNGDGHTDLLFNSWNYGSTGVLVNDGAGHFSAPSSINGVPNITENFLLPGSSDGFYSVNLDGVYRVDEITIASGLTGPSYNNPALFGAPGFNEEYYLNKYTDVREGISAGLHKSGLDHYLEIGRLNLYDAFAPGTRVYGSEEIDEVFYAFDYTEGIFEVGEDLISVVRGERLDTLSSVERLEFINTSVAIDFAKGQSAYNSATLIGTAFGAEYIEEYFAIGLSIFDSGSTVSDVAQLITQNNLIENLFGIDSNEDWVVHVYENVVGVAPDEAVRALYTGYLDNGDFSKAELLAIAQGVESIEVQVGIVGLQSSGLEYSTIG